MFAEDQSEALISVVCLEVHGNMTVNYVRLRGLRKDCFYRDEATGKMYPANALMQIGLPVPVEMGEYKSYRWHFTLVKKAEQSSAELTVYRDGTVCSGTEAVPSLCGIVLQI
jgi:hypothetical protein